MIFLSQIIYIIVLPYTMDRRRRSSEGEEEGKGPGRSLEEWLGEKKLLEEKLKEKARKTRLDLQMSFRIEGGAVLDVARYECWENFRFD